MARKNGAQVVGVEALHKAVQSLRQGNVDVVVNDKLAVSNFLKSTPNPGVKVVGETSDRSQSVLAARKGSGYLPQLNQAITQLKSEGRTQQIYDTYFSPTTQPPTDWELAKENAWPMAWAAIKVTIPLTVISFALGLVLALGVALARMSTNPLLSGPARLFISLLRGIPVYVLLLLIFFGLPQLGWKIPPIPAAIVGLTLNLAAYAAETIRSAIQSIPRGPWEAGQTVGMDHRTTLRRVILPQAARTAVPPLSNSLIGLLKDTSLVSAILVTELFRQAQVAAAPTFWFFTLYALAALYYWVIVVGMTFI